MNTEITSIHRNETILMPAHLPFTLVLELLGEEVVLPVTIANTDRLQLQSI